MAFSYSFHLSNKSNSVSTISKVGQVSRHNLREYTSSTYDKSDIRVLAGDEKSIVENMREIYHQEFDEALEKYNEGKRADRKIDDYFKHISDSKADVGVEIIIQVGDKDFWKDIPKEDRLIDGLFQKQLEYLQELVPELKIASAVAHYDESSPHMHVVGVPVAEGFKKGLERQTSKTRVFTADRLSFLQDRMREHVAECMEDYPIFKERQLKEKEKGRNKDIPKHALTDFYELEKEKNKNKEFIDKQGQVIKDNSDKIYSGSKELDKIVAEVEYERKSIKYFKEKNEKTKEECKAIYREIDQLELERDSIKEENAALKKEKVSLKEDIEILEIEYAELKKQPPKEKIVEVKKVVEVKKDWEEEYDYVHQLLSKVSSFIQAHQKLEDFLFNAIPEVMEEVYALTTPRSRGRGR